MNIEKLENFKGNIDDLSIEERIIVLCQDEEKKKHFELDQNKSNYTDKDRMEAIEFYINYPKYFFVFCQNDLLSAHKLFKMGTEQAMILLDEIVLNKQQDNYIQELVDWMIFNSKYNFNITVNKENSFDSMVSKLTSNLEIVNVDVPIVFKEKIEAFYVLPKYFQMKDFKNISYLKMKFDDLAKKYSEIEDIYSIVPSKLFFNITYIFQNNNVLYDIDLKLKTLEDVFSFNENNAKKIETKKLGKKARLAWSLTKLGTALIPGANIISAGVQFLDSLEDLKDSENALKVLLKNNKLEFDKSYLNSLIKEFKDSEVKEFSHFYKKKVKNHIYNVLVNNMKISVDIPNDFLDFIYKEFSEDVIDKVYKELVFITDDVVEKKNTVNKIQYIIDHT